MLNSALLSTGKKVLCVNSEGVFKNGRLAKNSTYFLKKYKTSANVAAIKEIKKEDAKKFDYLLLETSYSAGKNIKDSFIHKKIDLILLTNVYADHIGDYVGGEKIKNQKDLFQKKLSLLSENIRSKGAAIVFSGDKKKSLSFKAVSLLKKRRPDIKIITYDRSSLKNRNVFLDEKSIFNLNLLDCPISSSYMKLNVVALAIILDCLRINKSTFLKNKIKTEIPGRFNVFSSNNYTVILDYAHEVKSLTENAKFIRKKFPDKKIKIVIRFSYYRTSKIIKKMTVMIASLFDSYVIYDKAVSRPSLKKIFTSEKRPAGKVAKMMHTILEEHGVKSKIIYNEFEAINQSIKTLKKNEVLYIIGDQIQKDISVIKKGLSKKK